MILCTQNAQNYMKRKATPFFCGMQKSQNYMKRKATPSLRPAGFCDLTSLNALHFCGFCVRFYPIWLQSKVWANNSL